MLRLLIVCLLWLSGVYSHGTHMHMGGHIELQKGIVPCPPMYHGIVYSQKPSPPSLPIVVKPLEPIAYLKKEVAIHQMPNQIQYIHQLPAVQKPSVTYIQTAVHQPPQSIIKPYIQPIVQPKLIYQKPAYVAPIYPKPMLDIAPKVYLKKIEQPVTQVVYQKPTIYKSVQPQPVHIAPKVVHVQPPPISYVKVPQIPLPVIHPAPLIHPIAKIPDAKPCP